MKKEELLIYQGKNGEIILKEDVENDTIWANQKQIAEIFGVDRTVVSKHISNIFKDGEVEEKVVCAIFAHTTQHGAIKGKKQIKDVKFYNLDIILSIGYRTNSFKAIEFRKWATKTLKDHITKGFTINPKRIESNYDKFLQAVEDVKNLLPENNSIETNDILDLIKSFANTWFSLESYDEDKLPTSGFTLKDLEINSDDLYIDIAKFKKDLINKKQATELFAQEKIKNSLSGILGNIFQTFGGKDLYPTIEEKAGHLLYFIVKNHPFTDGNKRTGAFSFIWFLQRIGFQFKEKITPEALTVITLLVAESDPKDKERIVGLIILLLKK